VREDAVDRALPMLLLDLLHHLGGRRRADRLGRQRRTDEVFGPA
jgi:hypothetical protein